MRRLRLLPPLVAALALGATSAQGAGKSGTNKKIECAGIPGHSNYAVQSRCRQLSVGQQTRTYRIYAPAKLSKSAAPLLLALHGEDGSGSQFEALTRGEFNRLADRRGALIVYPDGVDRDWNNTQRSSNAAATEPADVGFLRAIVTDVERTYRVDRKKIYAAGFSTGGMLAFRLACEAADFVSGVALVAVNFPEDMAAACRPSRLIAIVMINGTDDTRMPWLGGEVSLRKSNSVAVLSAPESFESWVSRGDCALPTTHMARDRVADDGTSIVLHTARDCQRGVELRLYEVLGGGHTWPGGSAKSTLRNRTSRELDAAAIIWAFFAQHGR